MHSIKPGRGKDDGVILDKTKFLKLMDKYYDLRGWNKNNGWPKREQLEKLGLKEVADQLQMPFLTNLYSDISDNYPVLKELVPNDIPYDTKSSFSLYINHRETFTGITDNDRSLTMRKFSELIKKTNNLDSDLSIKEFGKEFRSPGHVPICVASETLLNERKGHTELVIALMQMADLVPAGSGCEIMGNNGTALSKEATMRYAEKNDFVFLEGKEIVKMWKQWSK